MVLTASAETSWWERTHVTVCKGHSFVSCEGQSTWREEGVYILGCSLCLGREGMSVVAIGDEGQRIVRP